MKNSKLTDEIESLTLEFVENNSFALTTYQAFRLAVEAQRNRIIRDALLVDKDAPTALEAIAIALGYK